MSIDLRIAALSPAGGQNNDGVVRGSVTPAPFTAVFGNALVSDSVYAIRKDAVGGNVSFTDISAEAISETPNSFEPWGATSAMSAGDALYIACDDPVAEFYFDVDTPGVWAGTGIEIGYSSDGITANALVQGLVDESNGFRNADGIYRVSFTPPTDIVAFSPVPGVVASRRWFVVRPAGFTGVTTAPRLRRMWILHQTSAVTWFDLTTRVNGTDGVFGAVPSVFYAPGVERHFALPFVGYGMDVTMHRGDANAADWDWEYLASDGTWKPLPGLSDPTDDFESGPVSLGDPLQTFRIRWTIPADWASASRTYRTSGGDQAVTGHFVRHRITQVNLPGPNSPPLYRARARAFGATRSAGLKQHAARTVTAALIGHIGVPPSQPVTMQVVNTDTGQGATFTIPANAIAPLYFALSPALAVAAGESVLVAHSSGGTVLDVEMSLQD